MGVAARLLLNTPVVTTAGRSVAVSGQIWLTTHTRLPGHTPLTSEAPDFLARHGAGRIRRSDRPQVTG